MELNLSKEKMPAHAAGECLKIENKDNDGLDWVGSAYLAELDFRFDVAFAVGALDSAVVREDIFGFSEKFPEMLVVKQLLFVLDFHVVFCENLGFFLFELGV